MAEAAPQDLRLNVSTGGAQRKCSVVGLVPENLTLHPDYKNIGASLTGHRCSVGRSLKL